MIYRTKRLNKKYNKQLFLGNINKIDKLLDRFMEEKKEKNSYKQNQK